jgi:hypothetical protein
MAVNKETRHVAELGFFLPADVHLNGLVVPTKFHHADAAGTSW